MAACDDDATSSAGGSPGGGAPAGGGSSGGGGHAQGIGDPDLLVGAFQILMRAPAEGETPVTSVTGRIYDGPTPANIVWEAGTEIDGCQLFTPRVPFCSPACGGSAVCVEDGECKDYPTAQSAGVVTLAGVTTEAGTSSFEMAPIAENYQPPAGTSLVFPPFEEGAAVSLAAAGDYFAGFSVEARGIAPIDLLDSAAVPIDTTTGAELAWTAPEDASLSSVHVKLDISHHGGSKGKLECDIPDTGSYTIAPALIGELLALGFSGYPTVVVSRENVGSVTIESGRVDLVISSSIERAVEVEGLVSCTDDIDCPDGETCQVDLSCG